MLPRCHYTVPLPDSAPLQLGGRTLVMGIVNVTPDSFSDGALCLDPDRAAEYALDLEAGGADLVDIGGESTRPGAAALSIQDELARVVPVLERLAAAPEVQALVERLGARAAAGEISVSQAGSATVDHLVKFAGSPLASSTSEPS